MGFRVGDRLSLAILGLCCGGTFIALTLTSIAKRAGQTGPPEKPDWPWHKETQLTFEERLRAMDARPPPKGPKGGTGAGGLGGKPAS